MRWKSTSDDLTMGGLDFGGILCILNTLLEHFFSFAATIIIIDHFVMLCFTAIFIKPVIFCDPEVEEIAML